MEGVVKLLDRDGAFITGRVIDDKLLRVVRSSLWAEGVVLAKKDGITWEEAAAEKGKCTVLSPYKLVRHGPAEPGRTPE